jgi:hypothetical protein
MRYALFQEENVHNEGMCSVPLLVALTARIGLLLSKLASAHEKMNTPAQYRSDASQWSLRRLCVRICRTEKSQYERDDILVMTSLASRMQYWSLSKEPATRQSGQGTAGELR